MTEVDPLAAAGVGEAAAMGDLDPTALVAAVGLVTPAGVDAGGPAAGGGGGIVAASSRRD